MEETGKCDSGKKGNRDDEGEKGSSVGQGQRGKQHDEEEYGAAVADTAAGISIMNLAEGKGEDHGGLQASAISTSPTLAYDFLLKTHPTTTFAPSRCAS